MVVYKKVRQLSDGNYYPLFIDKKKKFEFGEWMKAEFHPTKGFAPRSINGIDNDNPIGGWHCCYQPLAPHISDELKSGEKRVWMMCEAKGDMKSYNRPESQGGSWMLAEYLRPIKILTDEEVRKINYGKVG